MPDPSTANLDLTMSSDTQPLLHQRQHATTLVETSAVMDQLAADGSAEAIDGLLLLLHHPHPAIAAEAVQALVSCGDAAVEPLITRFFDCPDHAAQAYIIQALVQIGDVRALDVFRDVVGVEVANHCQGNVRRVAARGLGRIGRQLDDSTLIELIVDKLAWALHSAEDWALRYAAIVALEEIGTTEAIAILQQARTQESDTVVQERLKHAVATKRNAC